MADSKAGNEVESAGTQPEQAQQSAQTIYSMFLDYLEMIDLFHCLQW